jgi:predicted GH43/DUF377 family glycosyl hydrolase
MPAKDRSTRFDSMRDGTVVEQNRFLPDLFNRYPGNPILCAADWPYAAHTVFNPGATQLPSRETLLLVRVEDRRGISHLTAARSRMVLMTGRSTHTQPSRQNPKNTQRSFGV